jgi:pilus assembly protein Flp/PilA
MKNVLADFVTDEFGAAAIEYGLIAFLISIVIIGALTAVGVILAGIYPTIDAALAAVL